MRKTQSVHILYFFFFHINYVLPNLGPEKSKGCFFISVTYGVNSKEQRSIVRTFLQNIYQVNIDQIVTAVMNEYTDYRHTGENKMTNRDTLLDIFSDARVAAPVLKAASLHAEAKEANQAYLYVFKHVTKKGYYSEVSSI